MTASAVLRVGAHAPVVLYGTPAVSQEIRPGEVTIILGYDIHGQPVTLAVASLEWDDDLLQAAADGGAIGFMRAGMTRTVTP